MPLLSLPLIASVRVPAFQPPLSRLPPASATLGALVSLSVMLEALMRKLPDLPSLLGQPPAAPQRRRATIVALPAAG